METATAKRGGTSMMSVGFLSYRGGVEFASFSIAVKFKKMAFGLT